MHSSYCLLPGENILRGPGARRDRRWRPEGVVCNVPQEYQGVNTGTVHWPSSWLAKATSSSLWIKPMYFHCCHSVVGVNQSKRRGTYLKQFALKELKTVHTCIYTYKCIMYKHVNKTCILGQLMFLLGGLCGCKLLRRSTRYFIAHLFYQSTAVYIKGKINTARVQSRCVCVKLSLCTSDVLCTSYYQQPVLWEMW